MKVSKTVKKAYKEWQATSAATNVSLKVWARNNSTGGTELDTAIKQWFSNKGTE